jgi:hypothetical protein
VLQRLDPAVEDILITAAHVTLYDFDTDVNQWVRAPTSSSGFGFTLSPSVFRGSGFFDAWLVRGLICVLVVGCCVQSRKDVEGSLFVVKRCVLFLRTSAMNELQKIETFTVCQIINVVPL